MRLSLSPHPQNSVISHGSFALMVWHWLPFLVLAWIWGGLFAVNMKLKEVSMSRYSEWGGLQEALVVAGPRSPIADGVMTLSTDRIKWIGASPSLQPA